MKIDWFVASVLAIIVACWIGIAWALAAVVTEINENGLKSVVEEVWHGERQ